MVWPRSFLVLERAVADPKGFLTTPRCDCARRPVRERVRDWNEVYDRRGLLPVIRAQAGRCMDCGVPFCHQGCPLGTLSRSGTIWPGAATGRPRVSVCTRQQLSRVHREAVPGPCEPSCVLAINQPAVTIKNVEAVIADQAWERGHVTPRPAADTTGKRVAVIGSGPGGAGIAPAARLEPVTVAISRPGWSRCLVSSGSRWLCALAGKPARPRWT